MKVYRYKVRSTPEAEMLEGILEGESSSGVARVLVSRGLFPIEISEVATGETDPRGRSWRNRLSFQSGSRPISRSALALLTRQLSDLLGAGLPMQKAIQQLQRQTSDRRLQGILANLALRLRSGESLSKALAAHESIFPATLVGALEAGEASGAIEMVLDGMADLYEEEDRILRKVREALLYPIIVLTASVLTVGLLFSYLLPRLSVLYLDLGQALPAPTKALMSVADFCQSYGLFALGALVLIVLRAVHASRTSLRFEKWLAEKTLTLPIFGQIILYREIMRFSRSLATLVEGGVPLMHCLTLTARCTGNAAIVADVLHLKERIHEGQALSAALQDTRLSTGALVTMVQVGEENGDLPGALKKVYRIFDREIASKLKRLTTVLEPVLIVGMGLIVAFIVFSMMLPILELNLTGG